ncbi:MAG: ATP-dependent protease subunit HslV [Alphaproteobacteria bacterium]|nr:ATP-dependent protease subunit HslV [Alphaproteobacteria bacterium]
MENKMHGTTILAVRKNGSVVVAGDGQVTLGGLRLKQTARKVQRIANDQVVVGFAGATADAMALLVRLERQLDRFPKQLMRACVEMAKEWRTDKYLRVLEAMLIVVDARDTFVLSGRGDVLSPEYDVVAIGSGGGYAEAAARALLHDKKKTAKEIAESAMAVAASMCIYTSQHITFEEVKSE